MRRERVILGPIVWCVLWSVTLVSCNTSINRVPRPPDAINKALRDAVASNQLEVVRGLLADGATPDLIPIATDQGITPLMIASEKGFLEMTSLLLAAGANPNLRDGRSDSGETPLMRTARFGHTDIAKLLLDAGARIDARHGPFQTRERIANSSSALDYAVAYGHIEAARLLILYGAAPTQRALHSAITSDRVDLAWLLLSAGVSPSEPFVWAGRTPLQLARDSSKEMVATIQSFIGPSRLSK